MLRNTDKSLTYKIVALLFFGAIMSYLYPLLTQVTEMKISVLNYGGGESIQAWRKSLLFSLISSSFNTLFSIWLAIKLQKINLFSTKGKILSLLLVPILIGDVSIAFIGKVLFANNIILHENAILKFISLIFIQFWQYGTLFTYIFWIAIQGINDNVKTFSKSIELTDSEHTKDIILPTIRNIAILTFVLNIIFAFYENAKSQFIFNASRGTNLEFISRWFEKNYQENVLFNFDIATSQTMQYGIVIMLSLFLLIIVFTALFNLIYKKYLQSPLYLPSSTNSHIANILLYAIIALVIIPIVWIILKLLIDLKFVSDKLLSSILITGIASIISTLLAIQLGILLRLAWRKTMNTFSGKSLIFYGVILFVLFFPPFILYIIGFKWLAIIGYHNNISLRFIWVLGHILLVLPILGSFLAVTHYRTENKEIEYVDIYKLNYWGKMKLLFNKRYYLDYLLTLLISFSFIWNESTINNLLSDFIPSFISELKMSISGRGTNYSSGLGYLFISISLALLSITIWNLTLKNIKTKLE